MYTKITYINKTLRCNINGHYAYKKKIFKIKFQLLFDNKNRIS